jgi:hypothetical protein
MDSNIFLSALFSDILLLHYSRRDLVYIQHNKQLSQGILIAFRKNRKSLLGVMPLLL